MFSEQEKAIFSYHDGIEERFIDPEVVRRSLVRESVGMIWRWLADCEEPEEDISKINPEDAEAIALHKVKLLKALECQEYVLGCIRSAFKLPVYDAVTKTGFTEATCWRVWGEYSEWMEKNVHTGEG